MLGANSPRDLLLSGPSFVPKQVTSQPQVICRQCTVLSFPYPPASQGQPEGKMAGFPVSQGAKGRGYWKVTREKEL